MTLLKKLTNEYFPAEEQARYGCSNLREPNNKVGVLNSDCEIGWEPGRAFCNTTLINGKAIGDSVDVSNASNCLILSPMAFDAEVILRNKYVNIMDEVKELKVCWFYESNTAYNN